jgi:hypothetical protein
VVLPSVLGAVMLTLTLTLATWHARLVITESHAPSDSVGGAGQRLWVETAMLGVRRAGASVSSASVRGVYVLGAPVSERWHLLLDSSEGALALPVPQSQAQALAERTRAALAARPRA